MLEEINPRTTRPTRYPELGYQKVAPGLWRFVDLETGSTVGPQFKTKAELLADLARYATEYGATGTTPAPAGPQLNGIRVKHSVEKGKTVTFIPLPRELWRSSGHPPCICGHCDGSGMWDTLAVSPEAAYSWTVHYPELHK